jgi:hypothetical protein
MRSLYKYKWLKITTLFLLVIFFSCTQKEKVVESEQPIAELKTIITIHDLSGDWVNLKYLHSIQKTKSPRESQGEGNIACITFRNDTAFFSFAFHEGDNCTIHPYGHNGFYGVNEYSGDSTWMVVSNDTLMIKNKDVQETFVKYQMSLNNNDF